MSKPGNNPKQQLRIGRGRLGGQILTFQANPDLRPTLNRVREAVFSMIAHLSPTHGFIDGCAGSGVMATEAASMGFSPVIAFEPHRPSHDQIQANWQRLGVDGQLIGQSVLTLARQTLQAGPWVIFMDPPYRNSDLHQALFDELEDLEAIGPGSVYIAESETGEPSNPPKTWQTWKRKRYGRSHLWLGERR